MAEPIKGGPSLSGLTDDEAKAFHDHIFRRRRCAGACARVRLEAVVLIF
jgi:hypothetical protein